MALTFSLGLRFQNLIGQLLHAITGWRNLTKSQGGTGMTTCQFSSETPMKNGISEHGLRYQGRLVCSQRVSLSGTTWEFEIRWMGQRRRKDALEGWGHDELLNHKFIVIFTLSCVQCKWFLTLIYRLFRKYYKLGDVTHYCIHFYWKSLVSLALYNNNKLFSAKFSFYYIDIQYFTW